MDGKSEGNKQGSIGSKGIAQVTGAAFISILLGLVISNSLDNFFRNASRYEGIGPALQAVAERGWFSALVIGQLLLLLFSLIRFYLGSSRYHDEMPETGGGATELLIDLIGAIGVFISFYITSVFIKNPNLFYLGFGLIHFVDLVWFVIAMKWLHLNSGMKKVAEWYIVFDALTLILLIGFLALDVRWGPSSRYVPQWLILVASGAVGLWDLKKLWPFYSGAKGWKGSLNPPW